jgi:hypothetical protein
MLRAFFEHGNWATRQGVQYRDLIFVNQVNGGDEWWTLKLDGRNLVPFESITIQAVILNGRFADLIDRMHRAAPAQCVGLDY